MKDSKIKLCPMLAGKEEVKAFTIGQGGYLIPTFRVCLIGHIECSEYLSWFSREHLLRNSYYPKCGARMEELKNDD